MKFASLSTCSSMRTQNRDQSAACLARRRRKERQKIARSERDRGRRCGRDLTSIPLVETGSVNKTAQRRTTCELGLSFGRGLQYGSLPRIHVSNYAGFLFGTCENDSLCRFFPTRLLLTGASLHISPYNFSPGFLARRGPQRNEPPLRPSCVGPYDTRAALTRRRPAYTCLCSPQNAISRRATAPIPNSMRIASSITNQAPPVQ